MSNDHEQEDKQVINVIILWSFFYFHLFLSSTFQKCNFFTFCSRSSRRCFALDDDVAAPGLPPVQVGKLVSVPLTRRSETSDLLPRPSAPRWEGRGVKVEGREQNHLTALGLSEARPQCAMSAGDMWLTTWPCCWRRWSEREREEEGERTACTAICSSMEGITAT